MLGASVVEGAAACWAQLACAETLRACERIAAKNNNIEMMCSATQAPLLHNAKDKVYYFFVNSYDFIMAARCCLLYGSFYFEGTSVKDVSQLGTVYLYNYRQGKPILRRSLGLPSNILSYYKSLKYSG